MRDTLGNILKNKSYSVVVGDFNQEDHFVNIKENSFKEVIED